MPQGSIITVQIRIKRASCQNDFKLEQLGKQATVFGIGIAIGIGIGKGTRIRIRIEIVIVIGVGSLLVSAYVLLWVYYTRALGVGNNLRNLKSIQSRIQFFAQSANSRYESQ